MWKKWFYISLSFNVVVVLTFLVFGYLMPMFSGNTKNPVLKDYPLNEQQKNVITALDQESKNLRKPLQIARAQQRIILLEELLQSKPDAAKLKAVCDTLQILDAQLRTIFHEHYIKKHLVYDNIQKEKIIGRTIKAVNRFIEKNK